MVIILKFVGLDFGPIFFSSLVLLLNFGWITGGGEAYSVKDDAARFQ